jgi:hypothetical protein
MFLCALRRSQYCLIDRVHEEQRTNDVLCNVFGGLVGIVPDDKPPLRQLVCLPTTFHMTNAAHMLITLVLQCCCLGRIQSERDFSIPVLSTYIQ